ncbi:MAG: helix-turn-helix transcriptional regulator [Flavisolibacter sp.]|nr:helix-turn-helix transcriptional regulator [Flavisolibacter sp.]MBD0286785.1 helix-turn-helix transcriptional regulator [Flavisolibacter sp.]MBD0376398.1 helix-turn-helix transcriptional regulator [Flavisolibacter sp.]
MINYYKNACTKPETFKQLFCKELLFVNYDCPLGSNRQDSWSELNYILYVVTGKKVFYAHPKSWLIEAGSAVFVKKGGCIIEKIQGEDLCLMAFFIPDNFIQSFLRENKILIQSVDDLPEQGDLVIPLDVNEMMLAYYDSVRPYFSAELKPPEALLELKFKELLYNIVANPKNARLSNYFNTLLLPQANTIQPIVEANFCYNLSLHDYASLCNRSLSSFKRDFQKLYKMPPARWLLQKKLSFAKQLLVDANKTIADVAFESGFEDSTHFSHVFKKHFAVSPLKYRQDALDAASTKNLELF